MIIHDRIYGDIDITEPVIVALINSKPLQRLRYISQDGAPHFIQPIRTVTRFEHSIGAWYLSHKFHRPIEEQIASLLHDVPHTAFSHVIDYVMGDAKQEYHDRFTKKIILDSEIPDILQDHAVDIQKVLHKEVYPLLDNDLPDISVDRWDYFMRDGYTMNLLPVDTVQMFLSSIKEKDARFYFEDVRTASLFAVLFLNFSRLIWLDPTSHGSFFLLGEAVKEGLRASVIHKDDLFVTDAFVMDKLRNAQNPVIDRYLARLQEGKEFVYAPKEDAEFYGVNKPRYVDPLVSDESSLKKLSACIHGFEEYFSEFAEKYKYIGVRQLP